MVLRHVGGRHQPLVVNEGDRLVGRAIGLVLPHRPFRQRRKLRRRIGRGLALGGELDLAIHGRRPQQVGSVDAGGDLGAEPLVELARVQIDVVDPQARIKLREIPQQLASRERVGVGIDDQPAFPLGSLDDLGVFGWIALGHLCVSAGDADSNGQGGGKNPRHVPPCRIKKWDLSAHTLLRNPRSIHVQRSRHAILSQGPSSILAVAGKPRSPHFLAAVRYNSGNNSGIPAA